MAVRERATLELLAEFGSLYREMDDLVRRWKSVTDRIDRETDQVELDKLENEARELAAQIDRVGRASQESFAELRRSGKLSGDALDKATAAARKLDASLDQVQREARELGVAGARSMEGFSRSINAVKLAIGGLATFFAATAIRSVFDGIVTATREQEAAAAQLEATLLSTGRGAEISAEQLQEWASGLQATTTIGDEAALSMQSILLTFKGLATEHIPRAGTVIADVSTKLGVGLKESAIQVGKALEDPVRGLAALRRVGVSFSEDQEAVIKKLVETGEVAKAQSLILEELESQFGGSAAAARDTLGGALDALSNAAGDALEQVGEGGLSGALTDLADRLRKVVEGSDDAARKVGATLAAAMRTGGNAALFLAENLETVAQVLGALISARVLVGLGQLAVALNAVAAGGARMSAALRVNLITGVIAAVGLLAAKSTTLEDAIVRTTGALGDYNEAIVEGNKRLDEGNTITEDAARAKLEESIAVRQATQAKLDEARAELERQRARSSEIATQGILGGGVGQQRALAGVRALEEAIGGLNELLERSREETAAAQQALDRLGKGAGIAADGIEDVTSALEKLGIESPENIEAAGAALEKYVEGIGAAGETTRAQAELIVGKAGEIREAISLLPAEQREQFEALDARLATVVTRYESFLGVLDKTPASAQAAKQELSELAQALDRLAQPGERAEITATVDPEAAGRVDELQKRVDDLKEKQAELGSGYLDGVDAVNEYTEVSDQLATAQRQLAIAQRDAQQAVIGYGPAIDAATEAQLQNLRAFLEGEPAVDSYRSTLGLTGDEFARLDENVRQSDEGLGNFEGSLERSKVQVRDATGELVDFSDAQREGGAAIAEVLPQHDAMADRLRQEGLVRELAREAIDHQSSSLEKQVEGYEQLSEAQKAQLEQLKIYTEAVEEFATRQAAAFEKADKAAAAHLETCQKLVACLKSANE